MLTSYGLTITLKTSPLVEIKRYWADKGKLAMSQEWFLKIILNGELGTDAIFISDGQNDLSGQVYTQINQPKILYVVHQIYNNTIIIFWNLNFTWIFSSLHLVDAQYNFKTAVSKNVHFQISDNLHSYCKWTIQNGWLYTLLDARSPMFLGGTWETRFWTPCSQNVSCVFRDIKKKYTRLTIKR